MRNLWFEQNIKEAVDAPRIHHQLYPMEIAYEYGVLQVKKKKTYLSPSFAIFFLFLLLSL